MSPASSITDLAHHLAHDDLDVLIVDIHALLTVHLQDFLDEVVVDGGGAADAQHIVGVQRAVVQLGALLDDLAVLHQQAGVGHRVGAGIAVVGGDDDVQQAALGCLLEADHAGDLGDGGHLLGLAGLEQLLNTRGRPWVISPPATPPVWKVRMVSWVPGSPMDWAAMMPTASPASTGLLVARFMP